MVETSIDVVFLWVPNDRDDESRRDGRVRAHQEQEKEEEEGKAMSSWIS